MERQTLQTRRLRHPMERWLLSISIVGFVGGIVGIVLLEHNFHVLASYLSENIFAEFRTDNPDTASLSDGEIRMLLSKEDIRLVEVIERVSPVIVLLAPLIILVGVAVRTGREYRGLRTNAVLITARHFPIVYEIWEGVTHDLGIKKVPRLYAIYRAGLRRSYASCVPGFRHYSAIAWTHLETCIRSEDWDSLTFILGHLAGHIRLHHVKWWYFLATGIYNIVPLNYIIGMPLNRAREYGCDKAGYAVTQDYDTKGLLMLTINRTHYATLPLVDAIEESATQDRLRSVSVNFKGNDPVLAWRVNAIRRASNGGIFFHRK